MIGANLIVKASDAMQKAETEGASGFSRRCTSRHAPGRFSHRWVSGSRVWRPCNRRSQSVEDLKLPPERFETLRDQAIACMALPDLKPTGRVITQPPGVITGRLRSHHDPLRAGVP